MEKEFIGYFLPKELLQHFRIIKVEELGDLSTKKMILQIDLEEINNIPEGYNPASYESKGFSPVTIVQDFPIRGKAVYLAIKRRRWGHKERKNEIIHNDYSLIADGSRLTQELSDFLKGTGRDPRRYDK